ncbi:hypothetical protein KC365_g77 [Hortaea werneckii]|nr:hypothetical protein KC365_g77 [Hortaea werneckii]
MVAAVAAQANVTSWAHAEDRIRCARLALLCMHSLHSASESVDEVDPRQRPESCTAVSSPNPARDHSRARKVAARLWKSTGRTSLRPLWMRSTSMRRKQMAFCAAMESSLIISRIASPAVRRAGCLAAARSPLCYSGSTRFAREAQASAILPGWTGCVALRRLRSLSSTISMAG